MSDVAIPAGTRPASEESGTGWMAAHWLRLFLLVYGLWIWLPWLAPVFMHIGWDAPGRILYFIYSFFCHQLPERSFFLFGQKTMYSLREVQAAWQNTTNPLVLRQFVGNAVMGWKLGWSDRMVSFYGGVWLFALAWWPLRNRIRPLPFWGLILLLLPIVLDGGSHAVSDLAGVDQGFRQGNQWLALLTQQALPAWFYVGNALGSFNSWMRLITGLLAGLGLVWFVFPYMQESFTEN